MVPVAQNTSFPYRWGTLEHGADNVTQTGHIPRVGVHNGGNNHLLVSETAGPFNEVDEVVPHSRSSSNEGLTTAAGNIDGRGENVRPGSTGNDHSRRPVPRVETMLVVRIHTPLGE